MYKWYQKVKKIDKSDTNNYNKTKRRKAINPHTAKGNKSIIP